MMSSQFFSLKKTTLLVFFMYALLFQNIIASFFSGLKEWIFVGFEIFWMAVAVILSRVHKEYSVFYLFFLTSFLISGSNFILHINLDSAFLVYFSGFRRLALPFFIFMVFDGLIKGRRGIVNINSGLVNLYWFVLLIQVLDFFSMQAFPLYRNFMLNLANSVGDLSGEPLISHVFFESGFNIRSFGILLNFHGSGLLLILLFLYKIYLKGAASFFEVIAVVAGVLAGGSLQNVGELIILPFLLFTNQKIFRSLFLASFFLLLVLFSAFIDKPLPYFGSVYMFEYISLVAKIFWGMLFDGQYFYSTIFGFGNLRLLSGFWCVGDFSIELGDFGFMRLSLESGLLVLSFWLLLCLCLGRCRLKPWGAERLRHNALLAIPFISILSLVHYPVLFMPINITIYMLSLAVIKNSGVTNFLFLESGRGSLSTDG